MELLFEIRFVATHKMLAENARKYGVGPRIPTMIVCTVVFVVMILYIYSAGLWERMRVCVLILLVLETVVFLLPHILAGLRCGAVKKLNGGKLLETVITVSDAIEYSEGPWNLRYEFADLTGAVRLRNSYKLRFTDRKSLLLNPDGFTVGSFEEFKRFLREKRPDLHIPE